MPDPKDPSGTTPEPTPQPPRAEQPTDRVDPVHPTTPLPTPAAETPVHQPQPAAAPAPQPTPPPAAAPAPEAVPTASAAEAPAGPPPPPAAAGPAYATAPPPRRRFRQVAAHRATQLVAVGVLGLIIGGGVVALLNHDGYGRGHGRPGISRMDERGAPPHAPGPRGGPGWENHGRFER